MLITQDMFTIIIVLAVFVPIISSIMLFMVIAYEKEIRILKVEKQNVELEKEFQRSKYMQLNTQIQPHFLFNTMNLILGLARLEKKKLMIDTLENFAIYLRFNYQVKDQLIPFYKEINYTRSYLAIQTNRFGSLLTIKEQVDAEIDNALVPPFLLQTITENAFKHGLNRKVGEKLLSISFTRINGDVVLEVADNGQAIDENIDFMEQNSGYGLYNIKRRLELVFGKENTRIQLVRLEKGTKVIIRFPMLMKEENESGDEYEHFTRR